MSEISRLLSDTMAYLISPSPLPSCRLYEKLILLVTKCEVYSVRATCFSALGLVAGTQAGANLLFKLSKFWVQLRELYIGNVSDTIYTNVPRKKTLFMAAAVIERKV